MADHVRFFRGNMIAWKAAERESDCCFYCENQKGEPGGAYSFHCSAGSITGRAAGRRRGGSGDAMTDKEKKAWKETRERFYASGVWIDCARAYKRDHPLCERCLAKHEISYSEEVHHKEKLTPENINDPNVTLNRKNLEALCGKCHKAEHKKKRERRWTVDAEGRVTC